MIEPLLLTTIRVSTFDGQHPLTFASGFFFESEGRLFRVPSRQVLIDTPSKHFSNRIEIELHTNATNRTRSTGFSVLRYRDGKLGSMSAPASQHAGQCGPTIGQLLVNSRVEDGQQSSRR